MKKTVFLLFFLRSLLLNAQMLDASNGELFNETPFFNTVFIKQNKIKEIKGYYSTKVDLDMIRPTNDVYAYLFNENGQLIKEYNTKYGDTTVIQYTYDTNSNVITIRKSDKYGFHSYHYQYDSLNRITFKEYRRDLNRTGDKLNFELDKTYRISSESYTYENTSVGLKKSYFNSKGILYQIEFFYKDEHGFLVKQESHLITGYGRAITTYKYGDKGLLTEKHTETHFAGKTSTTYKYEYDDNQNILAQHYYRNEKYITEFQIVYNSKTMLLSAIITRDDTTNFITILKFSDYTFFE
jgi:hypothetical protein